MEKVQDILTNWSNSILNNLSTILLAVGVLAIFAILAKIASKVTYKSLNRVSRNKAVNRLMGTFAAIGTLAIGFTVSLHVLGLNTAVASLLAGAGIAGIALGFAFQDLAANLIAGVTVAVQKPFAVGDFVKVDKYRGIVNKINLRMTELQMLDGRIVYIPNKNIVGNTIIDYARLGKRRIKLEVSISYAEDLNKVKEVALSAINDIEEVIKEKPIEIYFEEFGNYSINFIARFWVPYNRHRDYLKVQSKAIMNITDSFRENDITIPFPIRTLDFGDRSPFDR